MKNPICISLIAFITLVVLINIPNSPNNRNEPISNSANNSSNLNYPRYSSNPYPVDLYHSSKRESFNKLTAANGHFFCIRVRIWANRVILII